MSRAATASAPYGVCRRALMVGCSSETCGVAMNEAKPACWGARPAMLSVSQWVTPSLQGWQ